MGNGYSVNLRYVGSIHDLDALNVHGASTLPKNPRAGSDVYTRELYFILERQQLQTSLLPGAPRIPRWQWIRYRPALSIYTRKYKKQQAEPEQSEHFTVRPEPRESRCRSYGGILEDDYGEESYP